MANSTKSASAAGQDEQPWLVKSSTTARGCTGACCAWAGIPAEVSQTAGTFVCNHVFYGLMHRLATGRGLKGTRGGFIHVPMLPEQGAPSLPLDRMVEGLRIGIRTALALQHDVRLGAGAVD